MSVNEEVNVPESGEDEIFATLTPESFSFEGVLLERDYPKGEVTLTMDESAAVELSSIALKIDQLPEGSDDELEGLMQRASVLSQRLDDSQYLFRITGVSDDTVADLKAVADAEFEKKRKPVKSASGRLDRILPESEQMDYLRYFNALNLSVHIEQIVRLKDGAVLTAPPVSEILMILDKAPTSQKQVLQEGIAQMRASSEAFERRIDADFLAKS